MLTFFGGNIVSSEGERWKRYRKIAAPAFSEVGVSHHDSPAPQRLTMCFAQRNNKLVWDETLLIMQDLFDNVWGNTPEVVVEHAVDITLPVRTLSPPSVDEAHTDAARRMAQIALFVIGVAGFGRRMGWREDEVLPAGHQMTFKVRPARVPAGAVVVAVHATD